MSTEVCGPNTEEEIREVEGIIDEELGKFPKGVGLYKGVYFSSLSRSYLIKLARLFMNWAMIKETKSE